MNYLESLIKFVQTLIATNTQTTKGDLQLILWGLRNCRDELSGGNTENKGVKNE